MPFYSVPVHPNQTISRTNITKYPFHTFPFPSRPDSTFYNLSVAFFSIFLNIFLVSVRVSTTS